MDRITVLLIVGLLTFLSGCGSVIRAKDSDVFFPEFRVVTAVGEGSRFSKTTEQSSPGPTGDRRHDAAGRPERTVEAPEPRQFVIFEVSRASGSETDRSTGGAEKTDFDLTRFHLAYETQYGNHPQFRSFTQIGIYAADVDAVEEQIVGFPSRDAARFVGFGLSVGIGTRSELFENFEFEWLASLGLGSASMTTVQAELHYTIADSVRLRGGYRTWWLGSNEEERTDLRWTGPFAGIELRF